MGSGGNARKCLTNVRPMKKQIGRGGPLDRTQAIRNGRNVKDKAAHNRFTCKIEYPNNQSGR